MRKNRRNLFEGIGGQRMKFTIGTASSNMNFEEELKLINSSLLYADTIELIGMAEYAIYNYIGVMIGSGQNNAGVTCAYLTPYSDKLKEFLMDM